MRVLITRSREDAERLAAQLAELGIDAEIEPLFDVVLRPDGAIGLDGVQAVLLTSANGVRALAATTARRDLKVLAVGDATARAARMAGFADVESAGGDVATLADLVRRRLDPKRGRLLHVSGGTVAGDLSGMLSVSGFAVERVALYDARPVETLSSASIRLLREGLIDGVLLFSPRTATTFVNLVRKADLAAALPRVRALCLSPAVAEAVRPLPWRQVLTAQRPEQDALIGLLRVEGAT